ncbi:E3 ubiquitin-protein ligase TRIM7-like [Elgaria multicarinata webbii]|uniref:E3 ubiquitin-protein ligase TRIM7-like n=1 Tax=Elgaria multicarinata webbii TaxID=159646 RepID=UPI002FCCEDE2
MAAAGSPVQELCEEASCPICLDYFRDPVTVTECGHNFCRACLIQCWGEEETEASCPKCRGAFQKGNLRPNQQLAKIVEIAKKLRDEGEEEKGQFCDKGVPLEEASQKHKEVIRHRLDSLRKERERILAYQADTEKENEDLLAQTKAEREKAVAEFRGLHQFLEGLERLLLAQLEAVEKEIARKREEHLGRLSEELSSLESLIREMEEKCQQPASEFMQDVRSTLRRSQKETFENPVAFPPELKWRIWDFHEINPSLEKAMKQFKDALLPGLHLKKANATLDPDTAHPRLILSEGHKSMKWGYNSQDLPNSPERFDHHDFVLGCEGFTAGRHFWEISVGSEGDWAVGVARKSVRRKGLLDFSPKEGFWVLRYGGGVYRACDPPLFPPVSLNGELKGIRVFLNCDEGQVSFYDADRGTLLYAFSGASFAGETILPFFHVWGKAHLSISP